jgi:FG-GAP-like repeat/FG-GAP repeat
VIVGAGAQGQTRVRVINGQDGTQLKNFVAFSTMSTAGVRVAAGDVNGDGKADVIVALSSGLPLIKIFDVSTAAASPPLIKSFNAFAANSTGGLFVAAGDVNGDGKAEVIASQDRATRPKLRVLNGLTGALIQEIEPYKGSLPLGVRIALADHDGDGVKDIVAAAGYGLRGMVRFLKGTTLSSLGAPQMVEPTFLGGIFVG